MDFTFFDIICAILLIVAAIRGCINGLFKEALSLVGIIAAVWIAIAFYGDGAQWLTDKLDLGAKYSNFIAFLVLFIIVYIAFRLVAVLLTKLFEALALGFVNRLLGGAFAFLKIAIILCVIISIVDSFDHEDDLISADFKKKSILYEPLQKVADKTLELFSKQKEIKNPLTDI
ncbi:MAG: CvpA family protein [Mangrovibacterium sp.]